ncbi:MAG: NUDIX hydrolase [Deltaproteobacteria bacterium]|nr:MAG: NUDIX hydrolase [Deltaproteobacteria bacterium]
MREMPHGCGCRSVTSPMESGRRFADTKSHPWVAVDVVIYTLEQRKLQTLLVQVKEGAFAGRWAFPGGLMGAEESVDEAAEREVLERTGVKDGYIEQLYTFGKPERDPATRAVSVSYLVLVPYPSVRLNPAPKYSDIRWFSAHRLPHSKLQYTNIVYSLLPREFTLGELQEVYETILNRPLDRRNFRKKILALGLLTQLKKKRRGTHRPASLYAFNEKRPMVIEML